MISVFQTYFDEKSRAGIEEGFIPYDNIGKNTDYFENDVMKEIYQRLLHLPSSICPLPSSICPLAYIGVTSWKQTLNTHLTGEEIISHIQNDIDSGNEKDVYIYYTSCPVENGIIRDPDIFHGHWHRNKQLRQDNILLNTSGVLPFDFMNGNWQHCQKNYWIAKKEVFDDYCKTVLLPALEFFERPEIKAQMPKWYRHSYTKTMHTSACFTLEGLFGTFLANSKYSFEYFVKKRHRGRFQKMPVSKYENTNQLTTVQS